MTVTNFARVWDEVRGLAPEELRRLRNLIDALLANPALQGDTVSKQDQMALAMLRDGLLRRIPPPLSEAEIKAFQDFKPIPIEGEPLSETIIKERR
ncbi:MAG TPA: hypothetical protein VKA46_41315 [Gemmataceae bacterium]|nr:hypothetical protein [Gemmataceae bacterium]